MKAAADRSPRIATGTASGRNQFESTLTRRKQLSRKPRLEAGMVPAGVPEIAKFLISQMTSGARDNRKKITEYANRERSVLPLLKNNNAIVPVAARVIPA